MKTAAQERPLAALELQYFKAVSLYRRRSYEQCSKVCNAMLQTGHKNNVQMFSSLASEEEQQGGGSDGRPDNSGRYSSNWQRASAARVGRRLTNSNSINKIDMPAWMMEGVWQLKMRALTQRVYVDDLETNDDDCAENEEVGFERIATAARPGTSIKTAFIPRPSTSTLRAHSAGGGAAGNARMLPSARSTMSARPTSGMARHGCVLSRPGSSLASRPASRAGTASRVRATSAAAFTMDDATVPLYQASRLNPTIYAERLSLVKALFQFLFYHESDVLKAFSLCEAVLEVHKQKQSGCDSTNTHTAPDWWWDQQMGRCLLALHFPRKAESYLQQSLAAMPHPNTYLLLSRLYQRLEQPDKALQLISDAADRHPFDITFRIEQGRLLDVLSKPADAIQIYRLTVKLNPINIEALACIAVNYFYDNNPEIALMYYRRILSLGVHTAELYCNIALCCLYGGQIDLVLPCFQRALLLGKRADQKGDLWYNLSFVAITTGDFTMARRCLQLCLTMDAQNGAALNNLGVLSAHTHELMKAKSYLNAAKEVAPDAVEVELNLKFMLAHYKL